MPFEIVQEDRERSKNILETQNGPNVSGSFVTEIPTKQSILSFYNDALLSHESILKFDIEALRITLKHPWERKLLLRWMGSDWEDSKIAVTQPLV